MLNLAGVLFHLVAGDLLAQNITVADCDFGDVFQRQHQSCRFTVRNDGPLAVKLNGVSAGRATDRVDFKPVELAPQQTADFTVDLDLLGDVGPAQHTFDIDVSGVAAQHLVAKARGYVQSIVDNPRKLADFGFVDLRKGRESPVLDVDLSSTEAGTLRVTGVVEKPSFVVTDIDAKGGLHLRIAPNAPWGLHSELMTLRVDSPLQPLLRVRVRADVHGDVVPNQNPLDLGLVREAKPGRYLVQLDGLDQQAVKIKSTSFDGLDGKVDVKPCAHPDKTCALLEVWPQLGEHGPVSGTLIVNLVGIKQAVRINVGGMYVSQQTPVRSLDAPVSDKAPAAPTPAPAMTAAPKAAPALPPPPGKGPLLKWTVEHDDAVYGYVIYRAKDEHGPFERATSELIHALPADDTAHTYQWRDTSATPGTTVWYSIGMMMRDGSRRELAGAQPYEVKQK